MKPYTFYMNHQNHIDVPSNNPTFARRVPMHVDRALSETLGTVVTAGVTFASAFGVTGAASLLFKEPISIEACAQVAAGVTGLGMIVRGVIGSPRFLLILEMVTEREAKVGDALLSQDKRPQTQPGPLPSTNYAQRRYDVAMKLWHYTHVQNVAAIEDGVKLKGKPWARRARHGLSQPDWELGIDHWIDSGLIDSKDSKQVNAKHFRGGETLIEQGMVNLGYMRRNGTWTPKYSSPTTDVAW